MKASRRWLEGFLRQSLDPQDVAARLGMLGAPVDSIDPVGAELASFVVGRVTAMRPHPDADKLRVTTVDDGSDTPLQVICGAPNVMVGDNYPLARIGVTMPGGMVIERRKLRGEVSEGMLCSSRELGLGAEHDGIMTLAPDLAPGMPLLDALGMGDHRFDIDVTPNRPDLLGHKGIARELALSLRIPFRLPAIPDLLHVDLPTPDRHGAEASVGGITIRIDDKGCGRFLGAVINDVKVGPSPEWLISRLEAVGQRSINNVVDITNYVMLELNQPMHAYDADTLGGAQIVVRAAVAGERLTTLDGVDRALAEGTLVIAEAERPIGIAGVMGGEATEVSESTSRLLLECAWFDPSRVRAARRAAGLSTDASQRFERGTDRWGAIDAFRRAIQMLVSVAGGQLDAPTVDCFPVPGFPPRIFLRPARVAQVLGVDLAWIEIERCLVAIGATVVSKPDDGRIAVDVPGWRPDLQAEIDLIEEIARVHGYEHLPTELRPTRPGNRADDPAWGTLARVRNGMVAMGLSEVMSLPMVARAGNHAVRIQNPLSTDHGLLRDELVSGLERHVEANWSAHMADIRLFEVGTVFRRAGAGERPVEAISAAFAVAGSRRPRHWSEGGNVTVHDIWDARWIFEQLIAVANPGAGLQVADDGWQAVTARGDIVGSCRPASLSVPRWAEQVWVGEVEVEPHVPEPVRFTSLPVHPAISQDLALLVANDRPISSVTEMLLTRGARHGLESVGIIDEFRGPELPEGRRSVTVRLTFRATDRTLTDAEIDKVIGRLRTSLERELDVTLRSA